MRLNAINLRKLNLLAVLMSVGASLTGRAQEREVEVFENSGLKGEGSEAWPLRSFWSDSGLDRMWLPSVHLRGAHGWSTVKEGEHRRTGAHDPETSGWSLQALEAGMTFRPISWFQTTAIYHAYLNDQHQLRGEWEEIFARFSRVSDRLEWRFGKILPVFFSSNHVHAHQSQWIDRSLLQSRFLGEHGLRGLGMEATWSLPTAWDSAFTLSLLQPEAHEHAHGSGVHSHEHGGLENTHEWEELENPFREDWAALMRYQVTWGPSDFHQHVLGLNYGLGASPWGGLNQLMGLDYLWKWRENGLESGGRAFHWKTELLARRVESRSLHDHGILNHFHDHDEHEHEHEHEHELDARGVRRNHRDSLTHEARWEWGIGTEVVCQFHPRWDSVFRMEYVSGFSDGGLEERFRVSPALTWYLNEQKNVYLRLQYQWDHSPSWGEDHSVWAQMGLSWGTH